MKCTFNNDVVLSRPFEGPLAEHIAGFAEWAREQGYARYSRYRQVLLAGCFSRWIGQQAVSVRLVSSEHAARYLRFRARHVQIQRGDEGVQEPHRVFRPDVILQPFRKKQRLGTVQSSPMIHP